MNLKRKAYLVLLIGVLVFTAGCGGDAQNAAPNEPADNNDNTADEPVVDTPAETGMEPMAISGDLVFDPAFVAAADSASQMISEYLFDTLVTFDGGSVCTGFSTHI